MIQKQTNRHANKQTHKQTNKQTNKKTNKQTNKQTNRQTNEQKMKGKCDSRTWGYSVPPTILALNSKRINCLPKINAKAKVLKQLYFTHHQTYSLPADFFYLKHYMHCLSNLFP